MKREEDITERKQAEEALRESERKHRTLLENLPQKIFFKDRNFVYISCNENYARDLKIHSDEIRGRTDYDFYPRELAEKYRSDDRRIMESGRSEDIEERYLQEGQECWVHTVKTPVKNEDGEVFGVLGIFWDITERKRIEEALKASEGKYRALIETTDTGYVILDSEGRVLDANPEYIRLSGHQALEGIRGRRVTEWTAPHDLARNAEEVRKCMAQGFVRNLEIDYVSGDGSATPIEVNATVLPMAEGVRIVTLCRDITERKKAEAERERLITDLKEALAHVKSLSGLLPICANCKKVRDDKGYWSQIEFFLQDHADVDISHGICPDCARKLYPEVYEKMMSRKEGLP